MLPRFHRVIYNIFEGLQSDVKKSHSPREYKVQLGLVANFASNIKQILLNNLTSSTPEIIRKLCVF